MSQSQKPWKSTLYIVILSIVLMGYLKSYYQKTFDKINDRAAVQLQNDDNDLAEQTLKAIETIRNDTTVVDMLEEAKEDAKNQWDQIGISFDESDNTNDN